MIALIILVHLSFPALAQAPTIPYEDELLMIQGNSLIAKNNPNVPLKIASLGDFIGEDVVNQVEQVLMCESGGKQYNQNGTLVRGKYGEIGIAQFKIATWNLFNKMRGTNLDIAKEEDQISMIMWAFQNGLKFHWVCYSKFF